jgi:hypothetical protein
MSQDDTQPWRDGGWYHRVDAYWPFNRWEPFYGAPPDTLVDIRYSDDPNTILTRRVADLDWEACDLVTYKLLPRYIFAARLRSNAQPRTAPRNFIKSFRRNLELMRYVFFNKSRNLKMKVVIEHGLLTYEFPIPTSRFGHMLRQVEDIGASDVTMSEVAKLELLKRGD